MDFQQIAADFHLKEGCHTSPEFGLCVMEMVAWFAGERHSDEPACVCPILRVWAVAMNDAAPSDDIRQRLTPMVPLLAGTKSGSFHTELERFAKMSEAFTPWLSRGQIARANKDAKFSPIDGARYLGSCVMGSWEIRPYNWHVQAWQDVLPKLEEAILLGPHGEVNMPNAEARADELREVVGA